MITGNIPVLTGPLKAGTNYLQKRYGLSLVNLKFVERELEKQFMNGVKRKE
jgi:hypothetical protein